MKTMEFLNRNLDNLIPEHQSVFDEEMINGALEDTAKDVKYHRPTDEVNLMGNDLPIFLYRLLRRMHLLGYKEKNKFEIAYLMRVLCGCEIYWTSEIGEGFQIIHGFGTVIGSQVKIGKRFTVYQNCTVGHNVIGSDDSPNIGDNVTIYCGAKIFGNITICDNAIIKANSVISHDITNPENEITQRTVRSSLIGPFKL